MRVLSVYIYIHVHVNVYIVGPAFLAPRDLRAMCKCKAGSLAVRFKSSPYLQLDVLFGWFVCFCLVSLWYPTTTVEYKVTLDTVALLRLGLGSVQARGLDGTLHF